MKNNHTQVRQLIQDITIDIDITISFKRQQNISPAQHHHRDLGTNTSVEHRPQKEKCRTTFQPEGGERQRVGEKVMGVWGAEGPMKGVGETEKKQRVKDGKGGWLKTHGGG